MKVLNIAILVQVLVAAAAFSVSCNSPKKSTAATSPTIDAEIQQCEARGTNYRWENNECVSILTDEQLCAERTGYEWTNSQCVQSLATLQQQCIDTGGQWLDGQCIGGSQIDSLTTCQNLNTYTGAVNCIGTRSGELEAYLKTRGEFSWYNNVDRDIETIREKNNELRQTQVPSIEGLTFIARQGICWDLRTLTNQKAQVSGKLRTAGEGELEQASAYLNNFETAVEHTKQLLGCNPIIY
ncbi:hypothetical protein N9D31_02975 [Oligoflexaceae bacterium]|nr:hypothetical protein [Oligoflexaceae bacterium]